MENEIVCVDTLAVLLLLLYVALTVFAIAGNASSNIVLSYTRQAC